MENEFVRRYIYIIQVSLTQPVRYSVLCMHMQMWSRQPQLPTENSQMQLRLRDSKITDTKTLA